MFGWRRMKRKKDEEPPEEFDIVFEVDKVGVYVRERFEEIGFTSLEAVFLMELGADWHEAQRLYLKARVRMSEEDARTFVYDQLT